MTVIHIIVLKTIDLQGAIVLKCWKTLLELSELVPSESCVLQFSVEISIDTAAMLLSAIPLVVKWQKVKL